LVIGMNTKIMTWIYSTLLLVLPLSAQTGSKLDIQSGYLSNVFRNYYAVPDYFTELSATLNQDFVNEERGIGFYYQGSVDLFKTYNERNYHLHSFGTDFYQYLDDDGSQLRGGIEVSKRFHTEEYRWYALQQTSVYFNSKWILEPQLYGYFGARLNWHRYDLLSEFSYAETIVYARLSRFFDSGTSVFVEGDFLTKQYKPSNGTSSIPELPEVVTLGSGASQQFVGLIRVARSVLPKLGVSAQRLLRRNVQSSVRYLGTTDGFYYSDEEIFDDIYGYNSEELSLTLNSRLPFKTTLSIGSQLIWKHYDLREALDLDGNPFPNFRLREDKRNILNVSLQKSLGLKTGLIPLKLSLDWTGIWNDSNDPYYNYDSQIFSFGLTQDF